MQCNNCSIKKICKIYQMRKEFEHDVIFDVTSCNYKSTTLNNGQAITNNSFEDSFDEDEYKRLMDKINNSKEDINNEIVECSSCHGKDYITELKVCSICHKEICGNCGTTEMGVDYCSECWERL